ncbi:hypothetical protein Ae717Ps2_6106 [Pseudonocardia sp. Ae717_Ps2]|nr:hypothetical protein Ae717Ps2_6789 [Pseudonocardia sp. Ae717_Ps2]OLM28787.1 hypothetical protein Ae717Ps2_6106 [Pseudonocardia sp. Ae717_Ps2]
MSQTRCVSDKRSEVPLIAAHRPVARFQWLPLGARW